MNGLGYDFVPLKKIGTIRVRFKKAKPMRPLKIAIEQMTRNKTKAGMFDRDILRAGRELAEKLAPSDSNGPYIVPLNNGGVQFEWDWGSKHLEIEIVAIEPSEVAWFFDDEDARVSLEGKIENEPFDANSIANFIARFLE